MSEQLAIEAAGRRSIDSLPVGLPPLPAGASGLIPHEWSPRLPLRGSIPGIPPSAAFRAERRAYFDVNRIG